MRYVAGEVIDEADVIGTERAGSSQNGGEPQSP
jgi:hypothetical protein